jgi:hypothetical protein
MTAPASLGTPGTPWGAAERKAWRSAQVARRRYADDVLAPLESLEATFDVVSYGELDYSPDGRYPLFAVKSRAWNDALPVALVTGGVHGYETSGVLGALRFAARDAARFDGRMNLLIAPCVSPWGFERIQRWNPDAVDPNRSFKADGTALEARHLMAFLEPYKGRVLVHVDLHETTDSDETEFRPARAARDGKTYAPEAIPDGFYLVDDAQNLQPAFQAAIIEAVAQVTHIAAPDAQGRLIEEPMLGRGVISYEVRQLGLCTNMTGARFTTTTEVYPDSPRTTPEQCTKAQAVAARTALEFALRA